MQIIKEKINTRTDEYVSESQAAAMLQLTKGTLRNIRTGKLSEFIPFVRTERRKVFYKKSDVIAYRDRPKKRRVEHLYPRISILFNDAPVADLDPRAQLTTAEAALAFGISKASLQIWRSKHQFIDVLPFLGTGSGFSVHYLAGDLMHFINDGRRYWKARSIERNHQYRARTPRAA